MKMITKVFLVIGILLACLIVWSLTLGEGGLIQRGWDGIADMVDNTWMKMTGSTEGIMPRWSNEQSVTGAQGNTGKATTNVGGGGN